MRLHISSRVDTFGAIIFYWRGSIVQGVAWLERETLLTNETKTKNEVSCSQESLKNTLISKLGCSVRKIQDHLCFSTYLEQKIKSTIIIMVRTNEFKHIWNWFKLQTFTNKVNFSRAYQQNYSLFKWYIYHYNIITIKLRD